MARRLPLLLLLDQASSFRLPQEERAVDLDRHVMHEAWWEEWEETAVPEKVPKDNKKHDWLWYLNPWKVQREVGHVAYWDVHIPKCAGTSWLHDVLPLLPNGDGYHSREACYQRPQGSEKEGVQSGDRMVVLLRRPAAHVYSQFLECAYSAWGKAVTKDRRKASVTLVSITTWLKWFKGGNVSEDFKCYNPYNMQARTLTCDDEWNFAGHHHNPKNPVSLSLALKSVEEAFFIGLVEHYQASLCLFVSKANPGQALPRFCNCTDKEAWGSYKAMHETHGVPPHSLRDLSSEDLALIKELTRKDALVYRAAQERFVREAKDLKARTGVQILCED